MCMFARHGMGGILWAFVLSEWWSAQRGYSEPPRAHWTPLPKLTNHLRARFLPRVLGLVMDRVPAASSCPRPTQPAPQREARAWTPPFVAVNLQPHPRARGLHLAWCPVGYVTSHTVGTCQTRLQLKAHI